MSPSRGFDGPAAALGLIVSAVVRLGLDLDVQLVLVSATGQGPLQRGQRGHWDAGTRHTHETHTHTNNTHIHRLLLLHDFTMIITITCLHTDY